MSPLEQEPSAAPLARIHDAAPGRVGILSGRALAAVLLGWSLLKVLLRYLRREAPGLVRFQRNYGSEGLVAIEAHERRLMARFSRCVACGRCDVGEGDRIAASRGAYPGLMQLVLASSRSMPDYGAAAEGFAFVPDDVLTRKVAVCPVRIPFADLARFVRGKA